MSKEELHLAASGQKHAFIRDGALILYFDKAETPFVARFDLDSLAQANFEISDKKDGIYHLTLRDYSGETQTIGEFASKNDAHQALYMLLQALLEQPTGIMLVEKNSNPVWRGIKTFLNYLLMFFVAAYLLYILATLPIWPTGPAIEQPAATPLATGKVSEIPEGEAIDADTLLGTSPVQDQVPQDQPVQAPAE